MGWLRDSCAMRPGRKYKSLLLQAKADFEEQRLQTPLLLRLGGLLVESSQSGVLVAASQGSDTHRFSLSCHSTW